MLDTVYGLKPTDIQYLSKLQGADVIQICVGQYQLVLSFQSAPAVCVEGRCELLEPDRGIADVWESNARSKSFRFLELLGQRVDQVTIDTPRSFKLAFNNGLTFRVVDNSDQYETFSVGGLYV